jgi:hypothetical protein
MRFISNFALFWYDFIIGDDWMIAAAIAATLVLIVLLPHSSLWWVLPVVVVLALGFSLWRATRSNPSG